MTWTVKEALNETIGIGKPGDAVRLKVEDTFYHIGRADSYTQAMESFAEFLDAEAVKYNWITENGKKIAEIIVSKDDVYINDVNGLHFTRRYRYKTVKESLEKAFSNPECIRVYLKSKKKYPDGTGEFYQIGYAETLESALRTFGGFLDLKAELDDEDQRIAHVFVNGDDVIRIKVEIDGVESYRFYANPKRFIPETVKEALEKAFSNPDCEYVSLKAENLLIAVAKNLNDALGIFSEYLDAKVTGFDENAETSTIFISKADANIRPNPESVETVKESKEPKEPKMFENLKPGNLTKEDVKDLQAFVQHKDKVLDAVCWNCYNAENTLRECAEIVIELDPKRGRNLVESLKILVSVLDNKVSKKLK